ncbi:MAG TPA: CoA-binding protein [Candidatus Limnocylindrales bacterium]|nr:CoA-binding protein [Candidatus Limnocylindrales bacterium]
MPEKPGPEPGPELGPEPGPDPGPRDRSEAERVAAILDLHEGRGPVPVLDDAGIAEIVKTTRRIAVIGASSNPDRPSYGVFRFLVERGLDCVPVNPRETEVHGVRAFPTLADAVAATGPVDLVDVFRRSELCAPHAEEAVTVGARCLWLQLGVVSWDAARIAHAAGLAVVMDRCTAIEWRRWAPRPTSG